VNTGTSLKYDLWVDAFIFTCNIIPMNLKNLFPFEYSSCGFFRLKGEPKGKPAPILHGMDAIKSVHMAMMIEFRTQQQIKKPNKSELHSRSH